MSTPPVRITKRPPPDVEGWIAYIKKAMKLRRLVLMINEDRVTRIAALLGLFGPIGHPEATELYHAFLPFLFSPHRAKQMDTLIAALPPDKLQLVRVMKSIQAASSLEPVERAKFNGLIFIRVAVQLPDPKAYVEVCAREHRNNIRGAFSDANLQYISGRYRGVVGQLADTEYRAQIAERIQTIS